MPPESEEYQYYLTIILVTSILVLLGVFIVIFVVQYQKKHKRFVSQQKIFEKTLLESRLEMHQQTLKQVAHEMHDNLGQIASLIKINLQTLIIDQEDKNFIKIENTKDLIRQLIGDIKSLSVSLGADRISQLGFVKALEIEIERINSTGMFQCKMELLGTPPFIEVEKATILFRMSQEILNNIIKHSQTAKIHVNVTSYDSQITIAFTDFGIGFNLQEGMNKKSAGLKNIINRANLISASVDFNTSIGSGTIVTIQLPN